MPRPAKFSEEMILAAASTIVAADGPKAATIGAIAHAIGAPSGSIYHRFQTRDELLGRLWLMKAAYFQNTFADALNRPDARQAAVEAALSMPRSVRADLRGARIMLLHRREDFLSGNWPAPMKMEAERLGAQVQDVLAAFTRRLFHSSAKSARRKMAFAIVDIPFAAVRRYVGANEAPPPDIDDLIAAAVTAVIDQHLKDRPRSP